MNFIVPSDIPDFDLLNSKIESHMILEQPYLGYATESFISSHTIDADGVREGCKNFIVSLANQIRLRVPKNVKVLNQMIELSPQNVLKNDPNKINMCLNELFTDQSELLRIQIQNQMHNLKLIQWKKTVQSVEFWNEVGTCTDAGGVFAFKEAASFAMSFLVLPFSNADVERTFSQMNLIKNKVRNRMGLELLNAILMIKSWLHANNVCCHDYEVPGDMVAMMKSQVIYNRETQAVSDDEETDENIIEILELTNEM